MTNPAKPQSKRDPTPSLGSRAEVALKAGDLDVQHHRSRCCWARHSDMDPVALCLRPGRGIGSIGAGRSPGIPASGFIGPTEIGPLSSLRSLKNFCNGMESDCSIIEFCLAGVWRPKSLYPLAISPSSAYEEAEK